MNSKQHWENVYHTKKPNEVSWFQPDSSTSLALIEELGLPLEAIILDIGGGDSFLIENLFMKGYRNLKVLDISGAALKRAKERMKNFSDQISFFESNILDFNPDFKPELWHDRAVFHFLVSQKEKEKYRDILSSSIKPNGIFILGTFGPEGPLKCSGLEICRYDENEMTRFFGEFFEPISFKISTHNTPFGTQQQFLFGVFKRKDN